MQRFSTRRFLDLKKFLPSTRWVDRITWRLGGNLFSPWLIQKLAKQLNGSAFDLCYVDGGEWVTSAVISLLRKHARIIINYNIDDPLGPRDGARFKSFRESLPYYDLNVMVRQDNVPEAYALGAKRVICVYRSADEISHAPRPLTAQDHETWSSDVLFLGTWFPERGPFLLDVLSHGVPLTIRGANWHKAPEWRQLKRYWQGGAIGGDNYAKAIQCAKVNLGLLSRGNRDLHTTRSLEIPAVGGLLCAERTAEHLAMYVEGEEALFWKDAEECAAMCKFALADENRRRKIVHAGRERLALNGHYNQNVLASILMSAGFTV